MSAKPWWVDLAKAHVLVEDELTQALLSTAWSDVAVRVDHVGGEVAVDAMVRGALRGGATTVFGVLDRDFSVSTGWAKVSPFYRLERHEVENYLLDFDALAALAREAPEVIKKEAEAFARSCCPWMAAKRALREIDLGLKVNFPELQGPSQQAPLTVNDAIALVSNQSFWRRLNVKVKQDWDAGGLQRLLHQHHTTFTGEVSSGLWVKTFSGKEAIRHLRGLPWKLAPNDIDLAIRVARQWRARNRVPAELTTLLANIKHRASI